MERDFLGAIGRNEVKEKSGKAEPDCMGGGTAAMQWQFSAKAGAAPAFMSFRPVREEGEDSNEAVHDRFSLSGFRSPPAVAGEAFVDGGAKKQPPSPAVARQMQFGFDGQVSRQQQYAAAHHHGEQGVDSYGVPTAAHHPMGGSRMVQPSPALRHPGAPFSQANPMLRVQSLPNVAGGSPFKNQSFSSVVGVYGGARDLRNLKSPQMTIFYDGSVNVFDNVPVEKAQQLMLLASRASILSPPSAARKSDSPISGSPLGVPEVLPARKIIIQKHEHTFPHVSVVSTPIPVVSQVVTLPKSTSCSNNESAGPTSAGLPLVVPPISQASSSKPIPLATTTAASIMPRAVPQARKASLARFLEKRKERVTTVMPYPSSKSPAESSDTLGSPSTPIKSSCTDVAPTRNNGDETFCLGQARNISFSSEQPPSTKLQI